MNLCAVINGSELLMDIIRKSFSRIGIIDVEYCVASSMPKEAHRSIAIIGEPNSIQENYILNYELKYNPLMYYIGPIGGIVSYSKLISYTDVLVYDTENKNEELKELQRTLGTSKVHYIPNPVYSLELPPRTKQLGYVYGLLKYDVVSEEDYLELFELSARVTVKLGLLCNGHVGQIQDYVCDKGLPVEIRIIYNVDEYYRYFCDIDRIQQPDEYHALGLIANIPSFSEADALISWKERRNQLLSVYHSLELGKIPLIINNGKSHKCTAYHYAKSLNIDELNSMHQQLSEAESIELADQSMRYEKYGQIDSFITTDHVAYHKERTKINTIYECFAHLSMDGGVKLIHNLHSMFVVNYKCNLLYANIPVDYPWIALFDMNTIEVDEVFASQWFQKSLVTCVGFLTFSNLSVSYLQHKYDTIGVKSFFEKFTISAMMYPAMYHKHYRKHANKLCYVYEDGTNPFSLFKYVNNDYHKMYYGMTLPEEITIDDTNSNISWEQGCKKHINTIYPNINSFTFNVTDPVKAGNTLTNERVKSAFWDIFRCIKSCSKTDQYKDADVYITELNPETLHSPIIAYCIHHCIPIIVNLCPLAIEYLGENYPLFDGINLEANSITKAVTYLMEMRLHIPETIIETELYSTI